MFREEYEKAFEGDETWKAMQIPTGNIYIWDDSSTYIKKPPYFEKCPSSARAIADQICGLRVLAMLGDSVTTDHISPAGSIAAKSPAGQYLISLGVPVSDFNSYGARRGNHEVMVRGTSRISGCATNLFPVWKALTRFTCPMVNRCSSMMPP